MFHQYLMLWPESNQQGITEHQPPTPTGAGAAPAKGSIVAAHFHANKLVMALVITYPEKCGNVKLDLMLEVVVHHLPVQTGGYALVSGEVPQSHPKSEMVIPCLVIRRRLGRQGFHVGQVREDAPSLRQLSDVPLENAKRKNQRLHFVLLHCVNCGPIRS